MTTHSARDVQEALPTVRLLLDRADPMLALAARALLSLALALMGDWAAAQREAASVLEYPFTACQSVAFGVLALAALHGGRPADALDHAEQGARVALRGIRVMITAESYHHLARAEALHALGRFPEAHAAMRDARNRILNIADTLDETTLRESFLTNVDVNVRTLTLASEWLDENAD